MNISLQLNTFVHFLVNILLDTRTPVRHAVLSAVPEAHSYCVLAVNKTTVVCTALNTFSVSLSILIVQLVCLLFFNTIYYDMNHYLLTPKGIYVSS